MTPTETRPARCACGGELRLMTRGGEPIPHSSRRGFHKARCTNGHKGGVDTARYPEALTEMTRQEETFRLGLDPMDPGRAQLGLAGSRRFGRPLGAAK